MVDYRCVSCKKTVKGILVETRIRCPFCNAKTLEKTQDRVLEPIKAR